MTVPTDLADRTSEMLEIVARMVLRDAERVGAATLASVHAAVASGRFDEVISARGPGIAPREGLLREIDELVGEFGDQVPAVHLLHYRAPESLSIVLRDVVDRWHDPERPPTLADVRAAIAVGRLSALIGQGTLDPDEHETVIEQLNELIRIHGARVPAREWIGPGDGKL